MKRNDQNLLEDFGRCIEKVSNLIEEIDPCIIIYPIKGAVPIADLLRIINPSISGRYNEYIPTSSTIVDTNQVIYGWFRNFIEEEHVVGEEQSIITIDEVVSGSSIVRASKQIRRAINDYGRTKCITNEDLCKEIVYHSIAIKDKRNERDGKGLNNGYLKIRNIGFVSSIKLIRLFLAMGYSFFTIFFNSFSILTFSTLPVLSKFWYLACVNNLFMKL